MHFQYPGFLFALAALAIPVIVHLFNFRRYKKLYFSNVQFLKQVNEQQATKRNLKERLILLSRLLAIFFLVLAFAKPYFKNSSTTSFGLQQVVSIFVDNSNSMQALGNDGSLLDEAKGKAKEIAASYGPNTRFQLLTQEFYGKNQRLVDKAEFNNDVDAINLSSRSRSLEAITARQQGLLTNLGNTDRRVYIISDFQKNLGDKQIQLPENVSVNLVQLKANDLPNIAIDSVWLQGAVQRPGEVEKLVFKLHNYADEKAVNIPIKLFVNNRQKALGSYTIGAGAISTDTLSFSGLQAGWQTAELKLQDNPVTFDNIFHFSFEVSPQMPVLMIDEGKPDVFVKAALDAEPFFNTTFKPYGSINYSTLLSYPFIVLSGIKSVSPGLAQQLKLYIQKGGNLSVFPATDIDLKSYQAFLEGMQVPAYGKIITDTTKVSSINLQAALYKNTFENMPQNPDLPKVYAYYTLKDNSGEKLMLLPNGRPFWEQFTVGSGKVYLCAVPLNESFSNLPRHSLFVTTLLRMGLVSGHNQQLYATVGQTQPIELSNVNIGADEVLKFSNGNEQIIPDVRVRDGVTTLFMSDQIGKPGTYKLIKKDSLVQLQSFNNDTKESDMHYATPAQLEKIAGKNGHVYQSVSPSFKNNANLSGLGFQLWKLCLILALIFLGAEILLIRFFKTGSGLTTNAN